MTIYRRGKLVRNNTLFAGLIVVALDLGHILGVVTAQWLL